MKKENKIFKSAYLIFLAVLIVLVAICSIYVHSVISGYEKAQPEYQAEKAIQQLKSESNDANAFWQTYNLKEIETVGIENGVDIKNKYLSYFSEDGVEYAVKNGIYAEDELHYTIKNGKIELAEVVLKATSPLKSKLLVFSYRDWAIEEIIPLIDKKEYEISIPKDFTVKANGKVLESDKTEENGNLKYLIQGVYFEPQFEISNAQGEKADYVINKNKVLVEYYDYTLTLPQSLKVKINGQVTQGDLLDNGNVFYEIKFLKKPQVIISDLYGNEVEYNGKVFPLTYMTIIAPDNFKVLLDGGNVSDDAISKKAPDEYKIISDLLTNLPMECRYNIAVLKKDAKVEVFNNNEEAVILEDGAKIHDLTKNTQTTNVIPDEIKNIVDVLNVAQSWSLFMSNDLKFSELSKLMLENSYQYDVAEKYNKSVDKTMFSSHSLLDPAFTDNKVENFVQITDDCFSVDISFVKHMRLVTGKYVDDPMNDRFYFIKSDGKWLLAAMKEVVTDEQ